MSRQIANHAGPRYVREIGWGAMKPRISTGWIVSVITLLLALTVGSFIIAAVNEGATQAIVSGLGSTFLSLALALLVTEILLRPLFTRDVIEAAGIRHRVAEIGFIDLQMDSALDFAGFYGSGSQIWMTVPNPVEWIRRDLEILLDSAEKRGAEYEIAFPQPGHSARTVAKSIGLDEDQFDLQVQEAAGLLEREWRSRAPRKSRLTIYWLENSPRSFLAYNGQSAIMGIENSIYRDTQRSYALQIDMKKNSDMQTWVTKSIALNKKSVVDPQVWVSSGAPA